MGKATSSLYDIVCPTSGTIGTGQIADADGIPLGANSDNLATLYYVLPTASANTQFVSNFRVITSANTTDNLDSRWMALATLNTDAGPTLKWLPGAVTLPLPDNGQQIQWGSNVQQLGRGAYKIVLDGGDRRPCRRPLQMLVRHVGARYGQDSDAAPCTVARMRPDPVRR
jgi:hypothetical protein